MEPTQDQNQNQSMPAENPVTPPSESVTFSPLPPKPAGSKFPKAIILIVVLIILGVGGYLIFKRGGEDYEEISPTSEPITGGEELTPVPTATPAPIDKTKIKIEVQNGTGISGEAAYLSDQLKLTGYSAITVGNAEDQTNITAVVTFIKTISPQVQDEITGKLKTIYQEVEIKTSSTLKTDVLIISGLRKGQTAKPSATPAASPSVSPSPTATPV